ncbi:MAG: hypothetical protein LBL60_03725 [Mycoplasmataceae bacterium]|nr:hypothetical protein [Mycoplasmataceae bacterium]
MVSKTVKGQYSYLRIINLLAIAIYIVFPYILVMNIMNWVKSMDTTLVQVSMFFTFLISLVTFVCSIVLLIKRKELKQGLIDSIFRIILMVLTTLILIIGIVSLLYMSGVPLKYAIVLVDYVTIAFIPISLITLGIFIYFFIVNRPKK